MGTTVLRRGGSILLLSGIACLVASAPVHAEPQKLTLPKAVAISLQNNGDLKALREEKGVRDAGKVRAGVLPNPTLELEGETGALTGSSAESSLSIGMSQEFLLGGKREKRLRAAEGELEAFRWQLADRERALRGEVQTAFFDLLLAQERLDLADRSVELNRQLLQVTKDRLAAGDIPELEMNLARVELTRSEGARIEAERSLLQSRSRLATLMGLRADEQPDIVPVSAPDKISRKTIAEMKQLALDHRPDLKAFAAEKTKGDAEVALAGSEAIPNLTAGLAVTREATAIEVGGVEGRDTAHTIGLKVSMPIPLFDRNQAGVQEARARRSSTESRLAAAMRNVEREVETAYAGLQNTEKVLSLYTSDIIPQLEENLKLTREAYSLGETGILAVIEEQKKFFEVSDGYLTALHARQTALVELESAVATDINGGVQ